MTVCAGGRWAVIDALRASWPAAMLLAAGTLLAGGCGPGGVATATTDALHQLEMGRSLLAEGRTEEARDACASAVQTGGLQPDFYCEAVALLGRCEAALGNMQAATQALDLLEQGDADTGRIKTLRELIGRQPAPEVSASPR